MGPSGGELRPPCAAVVSPRLGSWSLFWYLLVPTAAFAAFLGWSLKPSLRKLRRSRSHVIVTFYCLVWAITGLNLMRCLAQLAPSEGTWELLWLLARAGMLTVEVAVLAFPAQGLAATAKQALTRTLALAGGVAAAEAALKAVLIYGLHIPLLLDGSTSADPRGDERWPKWAFWVARASSSAAAYAFVARLPSTRWRDALPAKPEIYRYAAVMAGAYASKAAGAALIPAGAPGAGYCVFALGALAYDAGFAPLVYAAFLSGFFGGGGLLGAAPSELDADLLLYNEMREAEFV
ncbi:hypothetical protein Rsub_05236 [Raphidocelis subcapitata]|uniref:Transmembrane protein n=1 Tax=Raphidocelis subcapitata TaxID=307507 RepID=A0A2V0P123_9CHLO|nr:hypothetical protein Rsub_05236 [Raphidocelis subcapitata]|eukprot:GBF92622.1 hypothetical protein Rsub_05236 [Raphidocelis subcapitata]